MQEIQSKSKKPIIKKKISLSQAAAELQESQELDNYISSQWKAQPAICEFLIRNAYCAMLSSRANVIFDPVPKSWIANIADSERAQLLGVDSCIDINKIIIERNIITNIETVLETLRVSYNDAEILERLNMTTYELIKFILEGNKMLLKADNLLCSGDIIQVPLDAGADASVSDENLFKIKDIDLLAGVNQFKVEHTALVEDRFQGRDTVYLYHGSRAENWYSILANGIKIGSKSKYFLNGAAHGYGIYLSNDINMSLGYSYSSMGIQHKHKDEGGNMILAIFQVINNPKWHKSGTIFVVDDENSLALRYLIVFKNIKNPLVKGIFNAINIKLNSGGIQAIEKQKKEMETRNITMIHNKRLMKEYQAIKKQDPNVLGFHIELAEDDNLGRWMIYITRPDNPKLEEQMRRLRIPAIEIEITFKESYPIAPPFIRVVYPHFNFHTGHITVGGSLCMEMLTNQGWSPTFNVENVITQIKIAISDIDNKGNGQAEIDERNYKKRYTMEEALDAFKRVLATHGWV
jgi:ubiquitin-protein ligase